MASARKILTALHTSLIDSRVGYEEALEDAGPKGLTDLFREMIALRTGHEVALKPAIEMMGEPVDDDGSFMATVHSTVISIRSLFNDLDEAILPGLIDGEKRILDSYDDAMKHQSIAAKTQSLLADQRAEVEEKIRSMQRLSNAA